ncbi:hypothetical protein CWS01_07265 [Niallia nealsonii]|uniref:Uncharacterized protein n=1 Tax=Niallia nealsonii TaxID=115979 RepID=A0A2N0Z4E9_9BACI|nr:hypothetical protein CWS01_07265 [Niallia nealsonii]
MGHYYRNLTRIIKLIDESIFNDKEKEVYLGILRDQLSSDGLMLLFYNSLQDKMFLAIN